MLFTAAMRLMRVSWCMTVILSESTCVCSSAMSFLSPLISFAASFRAVATLASVRGFAQLAPAAIIATDRTARRDRQLVRMGHGVEENAHVASKMMTLPAVVERF